LAVVEGGASGEDLLEGEGLAGGVVDPAGAVGVGEEEVVVLGEEADRDLDVLVGEVDVGEVVEGSA
jgi:hypothetical protein